MDNCSREKCEPVSKYASMTICRNYVSIEYISLFTKITHVHLNLAIL